MPKKKHKEASAPAPVVQNAAPGYGSPYSQPPASPLTAPGGPYAAAPAANGASGYGAPPPQAPRNPFINAQFLYQFGKPVRARITGVRPAQGGNSKFGDKKGWFFEFQLENGAPVTGRVNEGDQRHQRLYAAFKDAPIGREVILRLPHPGDATKASWTLDAV